MTTRRFHSVSDFEEPMDDNDINYLDHRQQQQHQQQHQQLTRPDQRMQAGLLKRSKMNELIMDYLVHEGFKEAAERFREEAGIEPKMPTETMDKRIEIRRLIEDGSILQGQSLINKYYPELLDNHRDLYFRLQQQHLIELIRKQKIDDVLAFVHDQLRVDELRDLSEMERTLALLAYENPDKSPYAGLLEESHRLQLASELNDIILQETSGNIEPTKTRLIDLMKLLYWTQNELEKKKIPFEKVTDQFKPNWLNGFVSRQKSLIKPIVQLK